MVAARAYGGRRETGEFLFLQLLLAAVRRGLRRVEAGLAGYGSSVYDIGG